MAKSRARCRPFWLIVNQQDGHVEVYTYHTKGGRRALPLFSFEQEAETFLYLEAAGTGWRARETMAGELISVLCGTCAGVEEVTLDPLPVVVGGMAFDLMGPAREDFLRDFVGAAPACESKTRSEVTVSNTLLESVDGKGTPLQRIEEPCARTQNGAARRENVRGTSPNGADNGHIPNYVIRDFGSPE